MQVRCWPEDDGWHFDAVPDDRDRAAVDRPPYDDFNAARRAFKKIAQIMGAARIVRLDARPDDANAWDPAG